MIFYAFDLASTRKQKTTIDACYCHSLVIMITTLTIDSSEHDDGVAKSQAARGIMQGEGVAGGGCGEHNLVVL